MPQFRRPLPSVLQAPVDATPATLLLTSLTNLAYPANPPTRRSYDRKSVSLLGPGKLGKFVSLFLPLFSCFIFPLLFCTSFFNFISSVRVAGPERYRSSSIETMAPNAPEETGPTPDGVTNSAPASAPAPGKQILTGKQEHCPSS